VRMAIQDTVSARQPGQSKILVFFQGCSELLRGCNHEKLNTSGPGSAPRDTVAFFRATIT
jgi:hypothetical protein